MVGIYCSYQLPIAIAAISNIIGTALQTVGFCYAIPGPKHKKARGWCLGSWTVNRNLASGSDYWSYSKELLDGFLDFVCSANIHRPMDSAILLCNSWAKTKQQGGDAVALEPSVRFLWMVVMIEAVQKHYQMDSLGFFVAPIFAIVLTFQ